MKMTMYGKEINVDDKLVETYDMTSGSCKLDAGMLEFYVRMDNKNAVNLDAKKLEKQANKTLLGVLKEHEVLSRPETMQKAIRFYKKKVKEV